MRVPRALSDRPAATARSVAGRGAGIAHPPAPSPRISPTRTGAVGGPPGCRSGGGCGRDRQIPKSRSNREFPPLARGVAIAQRASWISRDLRLSRLPAGIRTNLGGDPGSGRRAARTLRVGDILLGASAGDHDQELAFPRTQVQPCEERLEPGRFRKCGGAAVAHGQADRRLRRGSGVLVRRRVTVAGRPCASGLPIPIARPRGGPPRFAAERLR